MQGMISYGMLLFIFILFFFLFLNDLNRTNTPYHLSTIPGMTASEEEINNTMHEFFPFKERNHWVGTLTLLVVGAMICIPVIMFCQKIKSKGKL